MLICSVCKLYGIQVGRKTCLYVIHDQPLKTFNDYRYQGWIWILGASVKAVWSVIAAIPENMIT